MSIASTLITKIMEELTLDGYIALRVAQVFGSAAGKEYELHGELKAGSFNQDQLVKLVDALNTRAYKFKGSKEESIGLRGYGQIYYDRKEFIFKLVKSSK